MQFNSCSHIKIQPLESFGRAIDSLQSFQIIAAFWKRLWSADREHSAIRALLLKCKDNLFQKYHIHLYCYVITLYNEMIYLICMEYKSKTDESQIYPWKRAIRSVAHLACQLPPRASCKHRLAWLAWMFERPSRPPWPQFDIS